MFAFNGDIGLVLLVIGIILYAAAVVVKEWGGLAPLGKICAIGGIIVIILEILLRF